MVLSEVECGDNLKEVLQGGALGVQLSGVVCGISIPAAVVEVGLRQMARMTSPRYARPCLLLDSAEKWTFSSDFV